MTRTFFLFLSNLKWAQRTISKLPFAQQMAMRFVAGESIDEAISVTRSLNTKGINATLDFLGESVHTRAEAQLAADEYMHLLDAIDKSGVKANVSLKLTQFGLDVNADFCHANVRKVVDKAARIGTFVRIDMEGSTHTERTLALVQSLSDSYDNIGTVLQAYLYRTEQDLTTLAGAGIRIRLCKGAYQETADKAFPLKADVDANYVKLSKLLLDHSKPEPTAKGEGRTPPLAALATHDEEMIAAAKRYVVEQQIGRDRFEFQMLYGIRRDLQEQLAASGYAVRAYVPYGTHWYPYFMRRLAERPANLWFFVSNLLRK